jgi:hypothetical protein
MKGLVVAFAALLGLPSFAQATEPPDRVVLQDGSVLQGRLSELQPDVRITLQLLTGESRTIDWSEIARVSGPSFAGVPSVASLREPALPLPDDVAAARAAALARLDLLASPPPPNAMTTAMALRRKHSGLGLTITGPILLAVGAGYTAVGAMQHDRSMAGFRDAYVSVGALALAAGTATLIAGIVSLAREKRLPRTPVF